ncbi:GNAT family protein [Colletotrichum karsti]|uniref:GNAT family protein n=1 Tax=Colletotrichum karsti TaxID=1095194 RepID=A0A9P6I9Z8_9PEZI|nr:GNAT family protein [Colletotrichum karsti]KAF9878694.1 GNAT family protein [Colletotrichum karsti]
MHIRAVTHADIPAITDIGDTAFIDAELNVYLYPYRREFPESWRARMVRSTQLSLAKPGTHTFVCVTDDEDPTDWPRNQVVGYARWDWNGPADDPLTTKWRQNNTGFLKTVERTVLDWQGRYIKYFRLDKSASYEHHAVFEKEGAEAGNPYAPLKSFWLLEVLGVHPDWQGKGVGKKLMQWGLERSDEDKVPIVLIATTDGQRLYTKLGFDVVNWATTRSFTWAEGGAVMIRDVDGTYTRKTTGEEATKNFFGKQRPIGAVYK